MELKDSWRHLRRNWAPILAVLFIALAVFPRFWNTGYGSLTNDEVWEYNNSALSIIGPKPMDVHPAFGYLFAAWTSFGSSPAHLRRFSSICGLAGVLLIGLVAWREFGKGAGVAALLLLGISPMHIYHSREARSYSFLALLLILNIAFSIRMNRKPGLAGIIGYILTSIAGIYTHVFCLFITISHAAYVLTFSAKMDKQRLRRWGLALATTTIAAVPMIWIALSRLDGDFLAAIQASGRESVGDMLTALMFGYTRLSPEFYASHEAASRRLQG
jgi:4-amino-4-deoxy-L-arabinose transferase-like glycosyltransferase